MRNEKVMTKEQIGVLMWVKALNDFKSPDCPNDTLNDKIKKFEYESAGLDDDTFWNGIKKCVQ